MKGLGTIMMSSGNKNEIVYVRDKLTNMIQNSPDLPTLGSSISNVVQLTSSESKSLEQLTNLILSDTSLTLKILRLSNSITYRASSRMVTSISTAIQLLGMDTIKACALAMILVDRMPNKHARSVRYELLLSLSASLIGRNLARRSCFQNAEEVAIAALFKNLGRLIVAAYDDQLYRQTMALAKENDNNESKASLQMLGCTYEWLTEFALREWQIPDSIVHAMKIMPGKVLKQPKNRNEWMQQVAEFSEYSALLTLQKEESANAQLTEDLLKRFGDALQLGDNQLHTLINESTEQMRMICSHALNMSLDNGVQGDHSQKGQSFENCILFDDCAQDQQSEQCYLSGKPYNALDQLLTGVQDVSEMMASKQYKISSLFLQVLEIFYRSLGFQFATVCLKDMNTNHFRARNSLGLNHDLIQQKFVFPDTTSTDLFAMAIKRNVDLSITDATDPKIRDALPNWYLKLLPNTKSFMILPLVVKNKAIGFFYADRSVVANEGISADEMKLIKALKGQILIALNA